MCLNNFRIFSYIFLLYILFYLFLCVCPLWSTLPRCYFVFNILQIFEPLCRYISARLTRIMLDAQPHDQGHKLATLLLTFGHKKVSYIKEICFFFMKNALDWFFFSFFVRLKTTIFLFNSYHELGETEFQVSNSFFDAYKFYK